jgi:hypothetical protein
MAPSDVSQIAKIYQNLGISAIENYVQGLVGLSAPMEVI